MTKTYTTIPQTIEAFQFIGDETKPPQWLMDEIKAERIIVKRDVNKKMYIQLSNDKRAFHGDWICRADEDGEYRVFVCNRKKFKARWKTA